jgi:geranylgeranyl diphosphate synthase type II
VALQQGVPGAMLRLKSLVGEAIAAIPPCPLASELRALIRLEVQRLLPQEMLLNAA